MGIVASSNQHKHRNKGQGLLEFALLLPVLILVAFGVLDLGRAFFAQIAITNAARVGARAYSFNKSMTVAQIGTAAKSELQTFGLNPAQVTVTVTCTGAPAAPPNCAAEQTIKVTVAYPFQLTMTWLFPNSINMSRSIEMMTP
jgi:Flp pilus assembly protein TadG